MGSATPPPKLPMASENDIVIIKAPSRGPHLVALASGAGRVAKRMWTGAAWEQRMSIMRRLGEFTKAHGSEMSQGNAPHFIVSLKLVKGSAARYTWAPLSPMAAGEAPAQMLLSGLRRAAAANPTRRTTPMMRREPDLVCNAMGSESSSNPKSPESNDVEEGGDDDGDDDDEEEEEADQEEGSDESRENSCETPKKKGKCGPGSETNISNEGRKSKEKSRSKEKSQETDLLKEVPPPTASAVESEELGNGVPRENQNGNQQGQSESNDGKSQPQATPATNEVSKAPEGHVGTPATPESSGSSEGKDGAKGGNEITSISGQKHGSVTNEESAKSGARESEVTDGSSEKGEDPKEEREAVDGQHGIASHPNKDKRGESAAAETSNIPFREKTSVALLLAALSRFYT
ncbi:hypothetical protein, conserved in T.vivax [Trypanosoma vivax Y486]|uniref:Uncharacterized protein n=1 Tax=Trypanosoma vivax (strain Y486) TaxID=1055687 RepID=F9WNI8_TRYVY|nr:hypothetical protein, conserved in T.vivax [Trypanosoma vivax Y486]|eukprot:CCD19106.1 hypothetical protein, conserved in T.vivax [Trypanosoma vivax Y486]